MRIAKPAAYNKLSRAAAAAVLAAGIGLLNGCANKYDVVTPDVAATMMNDLRSGKLALDCGAGCTLTWVNQAAQIHALDLAERWQDLAIKVMQIGFGEDLAYYYLGQAAQGLGYHEAAIGYYNFAYGLASGPNSLLKCEGNQMQGADPCLSVDLASSIPVLIQASKDALAQQAAAASAADQAAAAPVVHHHHHNAAIKPAAASSSAPGWVAPPPADAPAAAPSSGWVAPPPAPNP